MSRRKACVIALSVVVLAAVAYAVSQSILVKPRVPDALTQQIKPGMTKKQVLAILGPPHNTQPAVGYSEELWAYYIEEFGWTASLNPVCITFDSNNVVTRVWVH